MQRLDGREIGELFPEVLLISDLRLREGVIAIWQEILAEMAWSDIRHVPKNSKTESARSLIEHIRGVCRMALALGEAARESQGKPYDRDLLLAACLLHDVSKPVECEPAPDASDQTALPLAARKSALGRNVQHAVYAAHKVFAHGLPLELAHLVVSHTNSSNTQGQTWEAALLFYADFADSDAALNTVGHAMFMQRFRVQK